MLYFQYQLLTLKLRPFKIKKPNLQKREHFILQIGGKYAEVPTFWILSVFHSKKSSSYLPLNYNHI